MNMVSRRAALLLPSLIALGALALLPSAGFSQGAEVDEYVRAEMSRAHVPGLALAVVRNGRVVLAKGYGVASLELPVPVTPETIFQSGSIGKQFTATAVMLLARSGQLHLDDKIAKYLGGVPATWSDITVRHLLTHTAGLTDFPKDFNQHGDYTEEELLKIIEAQPPAFKPGERWEYSNAGYVTLGILIHHVTGAFYGELLREKIFIPAGMSTARVISEAAIIPNRAAGYVVDEGRLMNQPWVSPSLNRTADGSLYVSVLDLAKWDAALSGGGLLPAAALEQMWTPVRLNDGTAAPYGFGWFVMNANGHRLIEHEGAWQGFNANISRYVDDKLTVIVMANLKSAKTQMMSHVIAGMFLPPVAPPRYRAIEDKEPAVTKMVAEVMHGIANGTVDQNLFAPAARAAFFPDTAKVYREYLKPIGEPVTIRLVERTDVPEGRQYRYEFAYGSVMLLVTVTLNEDRRIARLTAVDNY
jgi:CubicO group peptidase (beta-lactamase class C family)